MLEVAISPEQRRRGEGSPGFDRAPLYNTFTILTNLGFSIHWYYNSSQHLKINMQFSRIYRLNCMLVY